ncbi:MAG: hypothetical protein ACRDBO_12290 [Lachnospiraceae bacterium]
MPEGIELLKKAPLDDIVVADLWQQESADISSVLAASDVLIGNGTIKGITYLNEN